MRHRWSEDALARGAIPYPSECEGNNFASVDDALLALREDEWTFRSCHVMDKTSAVVVPALLFAGDAAAPAVSLIGSVDGAFASGMRAAERLADLYADILPDVERSSGDSTSRVSFLLLFFAVVCVGRR